MILNITDRGFRMDNTDGYSQSELDRLNQELETRLQDVDIDTNDAEYYDIIHAFEDEVGKI